MITKSAETYLHATSEDSLKSMLDGGRILSLRHIAESDPEREISVEPLPVPVRMPIRAGTAYAVMRHIKEPDRIFLTRGGYLPNYGDFVIAKELGASAEPHRAFNTIPNEYTTKQRISLRRGARIYVPDEKLEDFRKAYRGFRFLPKSALKERAFTLKDRAMAFMGKVFHEKEASDEKYRKLFGRNAHLAGSQALGISVPGVSDTDVFVPYSSRRHFENAVARMAEKYPSLSMNEASLGRDDKKTFTGKVNGEDMDVVLGYGEKAARFEKAFQEARRKLTEEKRREIVRKKQALKKAWLFPETRYRLYKRQVADELGLRDAYF